MKAPVLQSVITICDVVVQFCLIADAMKVDIDEPRAIVYRRMNTTATLCCDHRAHFRHVRNSLQVCCAREIRRESVQAGNAAQQQGACAPDLLSAAWRSDGEAELPLLDQMSASVSRMFPQRLAIYLVL